MAAAAARLARRRFNVTYALLYALAFVTAPPFGVGIVIGFLAGIGARRVLGRRGGAGR